MAENGVFASKKVDGPKKARCRLKRAQNSVFDHKKMPPPPFTEKNPPNSI